jgi:hypothetical protein
VKSQALDEAILRATSFRWCAKRPEQIHWDVEQDLGRVNMDSFTRSLSRLVRAGKLERRHEMDEEWQMGQGSAKHVVYIRSSWSQKLLGPPQPDRSRGQRLTEVAVREFKKQYAQEGRLTPDLAQTFGLSLESAMAIVARKTWRNVR